MPTLGVQPILQVSSTSRILIAGQAPGRITHEKGIPFDDPSGDRLRDWLGVSRDTFYDPFKFAILPMGFCYPGTGKNGDLPPRIECAPKWRDEVLQTLSSVELTLVIGRYAIDWHLPTYSKASVTKAVNSWSDLLPTKVILPHPKAMQVVLTTRNEVDLWLRADVDEALKLQRPLADGHLQIVAQSSYQTFSFAFQRCRLQFLIKAVLVNKHIHDCG